MKRLVLAIAFTFCTVLAHSQNLTTADAKNHVGENATVCGTISGIHFASDAKGSPTFIDLDGVHPHQAFTVLIWGVNRSLFGDLEKDYRAGRVCAVGVIQMYKGTPEIVVGSQKNLYRP
jgi:hypothetical protein